MVRALVVDDSLIPRTCLVKLLQSLDFSCDTMENGEEMLKSENLRLYDVVFLDQDMPGVTGNEALQVLRERGEELNLVFSYSSSNTDWTLKKLKKLGYSGKVSKPAKRKELLKIVHDFSLANHKLNSADTLKS